MSAGVASKANPTMMAQDVWPILDSGQYVAKKILGRLRIHR